MSKNFKKNIKNHSSKKRPKYHPNKTYRIYPMFYNIFYACLSIIERDELSDYLLKQYYDYQQIPSIYVKDKEKGTGAKAYLLEKMINDLIENTNNLDNIRFVLNSPRIIHIKEYYKHKKLYENAPRRLFPIRVSPKTTDIIKKLSEQTSTIGEVIEIAIAYHLYKATDTYYDLITFALQNQRLEK